MNKAMTLVACMLLTGIARADALRDIADELRRANFEAEMQRDRENHQRFLDSITPKEAPAAPTTRVVIEDTRPRVRVWESREAYEAAMRAEEWARTPKWNGQRGQKVEFTPVPTDAEMSD